MKKLEVQIDDYFETPPDLFKLLNDIFNFQIDICANKNNALCKNYYTNDGVNDALTKNWSDHFNIAFMNPPYSKKGGKDLFIKKAYEESLKGCTTVCILPVKTSTKAFHNYIYSNPNCRIHFLKGRPKFYLNGKPSENSGRNDIMIVTFFNEKKAEFYKTKTYLLDEALKALDKG